MSKKSSQPIVLLEKLSSNTSHLTTNDSKLTSSTPKADRRQPIIMLERISDIKSVTPKTKPSSSSSTHSFSPLVTPKANVEFSRELKQVIHEKNLLTKRTKKRVFDVLDEIEVNHKSQGVQRKRENAVFEIIVSEKNYVNQLSLIINFFMKPTREKKLLSNEDYEILFGNIESIHNLNVILLTELYKGSKNVAKAFLKIAPFLKMYSSYAIGFKRILDLIQRSRTRNPNFYNFMETQETRPEVQNKLSALLIAPIQRIPRYKLLLQQLYELSSPSDPDFYDIKESLNKVEEVAIHINKDVENQENIQRLIEVQRYLKNNEPAIITPGRELIKEGILHQFDGKTGPSEKFYTIVLNDIILFCKMKNMETLKANSLKCKKIFPLNKCVIVENQEKGCFQVFCQNENIILYDRELSVTKEWINSIRNAVDACIEKRKTLRKESSARRPVKRKDFKEYNDEGLSPGLPLKRRRQSIQTENNNKCNLLPRRALRSVTPSYDHKRNNLDFVRHKSESRVLEEKSTNSQIPTDGSNNQRQDLFVFGAENPNNSFTFKITNMLSNIGSSVFNMFKFGR